MLTGLTFASPGGMRCADILALPRCRTLVYAKQDTPPPQDMDAESDKKRKSDSAESLARSAKKSAAAKQPTPNTVADGANPELSGETLPAPVWGHVMDYLPYTDVLKCLLVNKLLSFEAPIYVDEINIYKSSELDILPLVTSRRRFENVTEVKIYCLMTVSQVKGDGEMESCQFCVSAVDKIVPFLETFPYLIFCWIGGHNPHDIGEGRLYLHDEELCDGPPDHGRHFRRLIEHFCDAFERESLPRSLVLYGILGRFNVSGGPARCVTHRNQSCAFCLRVLRTFPLNALLLLNWCWGATCFHVGEIEQQIKKRNWSEKCLIHASVRFVAEEIFILTSVPIGGAQQKVLRERGAGDPTHFYYIPKLQLRRLSLMLELGMKLGMRGKFGLKTTKEYYLDGLHGFVDPVRRHALAKSTFDFLRDVVGYPFDEDDFVIIDDESDDAFKKLMSDDKYDKMELDLHVNEDDAVGGGGGGEEE